MRRTSRFPKPILLLVVAAVMLGSVTFFLSGCQFFGEQNKSFTVDEQPNERRIGVIKSLGGIKTSNQGTHVLQMEDGETILLRSLAINLDSPDYAGKMVEVRGVITYTTDKKQLMEVMNIDVVQDAITQEEKELSWQTYTNAGLGFSVKYRSDMKVSDEDKEVTFEKPVLEENESSSQETSETEKKAEENHVFKISAESAGSQKFLDWLKGEFTGLKSDSSADLLTVGLTKSKVGSSSLDAVKHTDGSKADYYVDAGQTFYIIHIDSGSGSSSLDDQNLFYEMLSSFTTGSSSKPTQELEEVDVEKPTSNTVKTESHSDDDDVPSTSTTTPTPKPTTGSTTSSSSTSSTSSSSSSSVTGTSSGTPNSSSTGSTGTTTTSGSTSTNSGSTSTGSTTTSGTGTSTSTDSASVSEPIAGFTKLESDSFNFSVQFPKSWYYSGSAPTESGVVRTYDFGNKPLDEQPGSVKFDIISGNVPTGTNVTVNGKSLVKVTNGDNVEYYYDGEGSRVYRVSGPASSASTLATMASSVEE